MGAIKVSLVQDRGCASLLANCTAEMCWWEGSEGVSLT